MVTRADAPAVNRSTSWLVAALVVCAVLAGPLVGAPRVEAQTSGAPIIDVWYGDVQEVGTRGHTQRWANVLGQVRDPGGAVVALSYRLNGAAPQALMIGQGGNPRLRAEGDFNVEIDRASLGTGDNQVVITATDDTGVTATRTVTLRNHPGRVWPLPTTVDTSVASSPVPSVDVVDGRFTTGAGGITNLDSAYDRIFAVGDRSWTDYTVEVPVTIHEMSPTTGGVGVFLRWTGHTDAAPHQPGQQPLVGWRPTGALAWYRAGFRHEPRLEIANDDESVLTNDTSGFTMAAGTTYVMRASVERTAAGDAYTLTVFEAGAPDTSGVTISAIDTQFRKDAGSVLFIANRAIVTFGDITVTPGAEPPPPPPPPPVNVAPVAVDDEASTSAGVPVSVAVLGNDSDSDGSLVGSSVQVVSPPASGSVSVDGAGVGTYAPAAGFVGSDGFTYRVADDDGAWSNVASVAVTVAEAPPVNVAPVAVDDEASTSAGVPVSVAVLGNDSDSDGSLVGSSVQVVSPPASGSVSVDGAGVATYAPAAGFVGSDGFTYRVADDDGAWSNVASVAVTVAEAPPPPPPPPPSGLVSDGFSSGLGSQWRWFDPVGDGSVAVSGGAARLSVPAGTSHDLWTGAFRAPRLVQPATDGDLEVEAKFDSAVTSRYQMQGIVVQRDVDDLVRAELHHDGSGVRLFVATFVGGQATVRADRAVSLSAPSWLRVQRQGDTWTVRTSADGLTWQVVASFGHDMVVAEAGLFVGNHRPNPAHTAVVDHFRVIGQ